MQVLSFILQASLNIDSVLSISKYFFLNEIGFNFQISFCLFSQNYKATTIILVNVSAFMLLLCCYFYVTFMLLLY